MTTDLLPLLWLDLETTGLSFADDQVLEVAACITHPTRPYERIDGGYFHRLVAPVPPYTVGHYVVEMHTKNGLWRELQTEPTVTIEQADRDLREYIGRHVAGSPVTLAGSGVATFDKRMVEKWMPRSSSRLTYYTFDTGVVRRFMQASGQPLSGVESSDSHRALDDVAAALAEAREATEVVAVPAPPTRLTLACARCYRPIEGPLVVSSTDPVRLVHFPQCPAPEVEDAVVDEVDGS